MTLPSNTCLLEIVCYHLSLFHVLHPYLTLHHYPLFHATQFPLFTNLSPYRHITSYRFMTKMVSWWGPTRRPNLTSLKETTNSINDKRKTKGRIMYLRLHTPITTRLVTSHHLYYIIIYPYLLLPSRRDSCSLNGAQRGPSPKPTTATLYSNI